MKNRLLATVLALTVGSWCGSMNSVRAEEIPAEAGAMHARLAAKLRPALRSWVNAEVGKARANPAVTPAVVLADAKLLSSMGLVGADIEAVAFIVLMEATKAMDRDLKANMDKVKAMNDAKRKQREQLEAAKDKVTARSVGRTAPQATAGGTEVSHARDTAGKKLDSMNDMSEMTSLRLQMMMDRRSKFISTLSNIMKKISSTQDTIVQNLK